VFVNVPAARVSVNAPADVKKIVHAFLKIRVHKATEIKEDIVDTRRVNQLQRPSVFVASRQR